MHEFLQLLRFLARATLMPRFRFDKQLFLQLIRELEDGSTFAAPVGEPSVNFTEGPIDGVLGMYNPKTRRITIDVLECFLAASHQNPNCYDHLKRLFDERLTKVLAHEGGHWQLHTRKGFIVLAERIGLHLGFSLIGLVLGIMFYHLIIRWYFGTIVPSLSAISPIVGTLLAVGSGLLVFWGAIHILSRFLTFWRVLAAVASYYLCYDERFARRFEQRVGNGSQWEGVIKIE